MEPVALCYGYWGGWWLHTPTGQSLPHLPRLLVPHAIGVSCLHGKGWATQARAGVHLDKGAGSGPRRNLQQR